MATEVWNLRLHIKGATIQIQCNDFITVSNIYDALMELEREDNSFHPTDEDLGID